jgi:hypothetical protein
MLDTSHSELVKSTGYPIHSPVSSSLPHPCVTVCHQVSTGLYFLVSKNIFLSTVLSNTSSLCSSLEKQTFQSYIRQQEALTEHPGELFHIRNYCSLLTKQQAARPMNNGSIPERWQEIFLCPTMFIRLWSTSSVLSNRYKIFLTDGEAAGGVKLTASAKIRILRPSSYTPSCHAQEIYLPDEENK